MCAHPLLAMLLDSQSSPSYRPSPEVAHVLWMYLQQGGWKVSGVTAELAGKLVPGNQIMQL